MAFDRKAFRTALVRCFDEFGRALATEDDNEWVVKGFIDVYKNIYTISLDTKVLSKIIELMLLPVLARFAKKHGYKIVLSEYQNHYPDVSLVASDGTKIALDLKSTYRTKPQTVNGFTLGAFTGYFRDRTSAKNVTFPYGDYSAHYVLGVIYSRREQETDETHVYTLDDLESITSVIADFVFLVQEKWRIAATRPGSGNTKNIGSASDIQTLVEGRGPFADHGEDVFDHYWMNYLTKDMARAIDSSVPYRKLAEYLEWKQP